MYGNNPDGRIPDPEDVRLRTIQNKRSNWEKNFKSIPRPCPYCSRDLRLMSMFEQENGVCANCSNDRLQYEKLKKTFG
ncbi:hypothetical protein L6273_00410 [Candidatus Parcubacteria bacterium]|nr:hypothetical protein [Candidatus Parcubacteria bacterium]